jgi:hypothetical protein
MAMGWSSRRQDYEYLMASMTMYLATTGSIIIRIQKDTGL